MAFENVVLFATFGAVIGIAYSLRKIYVLEARIVSLDDKIVTLLSRTKKK